VDSTLQSFLSGVRHRSESFRHHIDALTSNNHSRSSCSFLVDGITENHKFLLVRTSEMLSLKDEYFHCIVSFIVLDLLVMSGHFEF
jgi:hypothetical protein